MRNVNLVCTFVLVACLISPKCATSQQQTQSQTKPQIQSDKPSQSQTTENTMIPGKEKAIQNSNPDVNSLLNILNGGPNNQANMLANLMKFATGLAAIREAITGLVLNSAGRVTSNIGEVIKNTDDVLNNGAGQFKRINTANTNLIKEAISTAGTGIVRATGVGSRFLDNTENFFNNPWGTVNPFQYAKRLVPWWRPSEEELLREAMINYSLHNLKITNTALYDRLMGGPIISYLRAQPALFLQLLQNPEALEAIVQNPILFYNYQIQQTQETTKQQRNLMLVQ